MKLSHTHIAIVFSAMLSILICLSGCKSTQTDTFQTKTATSETQTPDAPNMDNSQTEQTAETPIETATTNENAPSTNASTEQMLNPIPVYQYPGDNAIHKAVADYLTLEIAQNFAPADVSIPSFSIVGTDSSNPDDTLVWGDFWVFNYKRENDTLLTESGGSYPGLMHLKKNGDGYLVTKMDVVADGSDNLKSAQKIFADKYDAFHKINSNQDEREKIRLQFISDYVKANKLSITKVKDFGWDPVQLP